jgi:hypothetical protein
MTARFHRGWADFGGLKLQFDFIPRDRDLCRYELIVLPDDIAVDAALAARLNAYLAAGGRILASGLSGLTADGTGVTLDALGVVPAGLSPFTATYFRADARVAADLPPSDHVMYERGVRVTPAAGATALAGVVEPYFERTWRHFCSHRQTPGDRLSPYAAAVSHGRTAYVAYPIFTAFGQCGNVPLKLRLPRPPAAVYTAPDRTALPFTWADGYAAVRVPAVHGHAMIVWEEDVP